MVRALFLVKSWVLSYREQKSEAPELKMAAGVLFGLSDATSDVTFKLDAELEF
jgi:hypothetical protein